MSVIIQMKDSLMQDEIDMDFVSTLEALNFAVASGKHFCALHYIHGKRLMVNIEQILILRENEDEES
jgi:hypothetical protein